MKNDANNEFKISGPVYMAMRKSFLDEYELTEDFAKDVQEIIAHSKNWDEAIAKPLARLWAGFAFEDVYRAAYKRGELK